jgi:hypothetical protein
MNKPPVVAIVVALCIGLGASGADEQNRKPVLSVCELISNWKVHTGREVRVRAIYTEEVVQERLYDPTCTQAAEIAIEWPPRLTRAQKRAVTELHRVIAKDSHKRAWVVLPKLCTERAYNG